MNKRIAIAGLAGIAAAAAVAASAASLGGMTSTSLGAEQTVVASCDTNGVTIDYATSYDATTAGYTVTSVDLGDMAAACATKSVKITLTDAAGVSLAEVTGTVAGTEQTFTIPGAVAAEDVEGAAVTIAG